MSTFLDVVELLISNDEAKASYADNPSAFLEGHGLDALDPTDVADAMAHAGDALPLPLAVLIDPDAGLDSAAAIDLQAQGLSLEREPFEEDSTVALDEDVPFDDMDDASAQDVVDILDAADAPVVGSDPAAMDDAPVALDNTESIEANEPAIDSTVEDTGDYLTDTTPLDGVDQYVAEAPLDDFPTDTALDDLDANDDLPDDFDLLD